MAIRSSGNTILHQFVPPILRVGNLLEGQTLIFDEDAGGFINGFLPAGPSSGEANTASNIGVGVGIFRQKVLADLQFKNLIAGTNVTLTPTTTDIIIDVGNIPNIQALNLGVGSGEVFKQKVADTLEFRTIQGDGNHVTITQTSDEITVEHDGDADTLAGLPVGDFLLTSNNLSDLQDPDVARLNLNVLGEADADNRYLRQDVTTVPEGDLQVDLGSNIRRFANIFALVFHGTATSAITAQQFGGFTADEFFRTVSNSGTGISLIQDQTPPEMVLKTLRAGQNVVLNEVSGEIVISAETGVDGEPIPTEPNPILALCELHDGDGITDTFTIGFLETDNNYGLTDEPVEETEDYGGVQDLSSEQSDYGSVTESADALIGDAAETEDYGLVNDIDDETRNYGLLTETATDSDDFGLITVLPGTISEQNLYVSINGVKQLESTYTINGNDIVFDEPPGINDTIELLGILLTNVERTTISSDGVTTEFNLGFFPASKASLFISINGVKQHSSAYGVTGSQVTLSEAPSSGDTVEFLGLTASSVRFDSALGDGTTTSYLLGFVPEDECSVLITINGIKQHFDTYEVVDNQITFFQAPALNDEIEFIGLIPEDVSTLATLEVRQNNVLISEDVISLNFEGNLSVINKGSGKVTIQTDAISRIVEDTSPSLGGNLTVDGFDIITVSDDINLNPGGTGEINLQGNTNATGDLTFQQGLNVHRTGINTDYTVQQSDYLIAVENTSTTIAIALLPASSVAVGHTIVIKDESGGASLNNITVNADSGDTIDGQASATISTNFESLKLYSNGNAWFRLC